MSKLKAACLHLALSAVVAGLLLFVLVRLWYPMPYFVADGGWQGLRLVVAVDLVLGPLLTLVVYSPRKARRALFFDYGVILTIQCLALAFGIWTTFSRRTALVVFADGTFYTADSLTAASIGFNARDIVSRSRSVPAYAFVRLPDDRDARQRLRKESLSTAQPLFTKDALLEPVGPSNLRTILAQGVDVEGELGKTGQGQAMLEAFRRRSRVPLSELTFLPLRCKYQRLLLAFRRDSAQFVSWHEMPPWFEESVDRFRRGDSKRRSAGEGVLSRNTRPGPSPGGR